MPYAALQEILTLAGLGAPASGQVEIAGGDPVLPTRYRVGTAGSAALAAVGVAVSDLWALRTGRQQRISVDLRAAAASLRSARYLRIDGKPPARHSDKVSGFYPVRNGSWIYLHCTFPNHRDAALKVLGTSGDPQAVAQACAAWDGVELEDAIDAAAGSAALLRTASDWARHPQSRAVAAQPLLEIVRIGDAPPQPLPPARRPLAGLRVLDLTRVLAGPTCGRMLAEHGADVLKISAAHLPDSGFMELDTGLGKMSAQLDLRTPEAVAVLKGLAREADVFSQSYRPGALAARGFSPEALAELRPGIVYVSLNAWGSTGPWRHRRGYDTVVQTVNGMAHASGDARGPRMLPVSSIDYVTGYLMAFGTLVALARRAREGGSWLVRLSLARSGAWIVDRGTIDEAAFKGLPDEYPAAELDRLCFEMQGPAGRLRHLKPVLALSETASHWERPAAPLGYDAPAWPAHPPSA